MPEKLSLTPGVMLYFARHGETEANCRHLFSGRKNTPLTARGREQAKAIGLALRNELGPAPAIGYVASPLERARITMEIAREESVEEVSQDLRDLEGLNPQLIAKLAENGVHTRDDLADLAVDELTDITGQSADEAKTLIMKAREHWFTNQPAAAAHE